MLHLSRKCFKRVKKVITASVLSNVTPRVQETFLSAEKVNASLITSLGQFFFHTKEDLVFFLFLNLTTIVDSYLTWWGIPHHIIGNSIKKVSAHFSTFFLFSQRKSLPPPWGYISSPPGFARLVLSRYLCFWGWEKIGVMLRRGGLMFSTFSLRVVTRLTFSCARIGKIRNDLTMLRGIKYPWQQTNFENFAMC